MSDYRTLLTDAIHVNRQALAAALTRLHITEVIVTYEGRDGSGGIAELIVKPVELATVLDQESLDYRCVIGEFQDTDYEYEMIDRSFSVNQALRDFTITWAEFHHANWEVDEEIGRASCRERVSSPV